MRNPGTAYDDEVLGKDPQPATMKNFYEGYEDNGGVHINSGIPNRAFALAAIAIGGDSWEKAGWIWYTVLTQPLTHTADFADCAKVTAANRGRALRSWEAEQMAVQEAWKAVGVI